MQDLGRMEESGRQTRDRSADPGCFFKTESRRRGLMGPRAGASRADQPLRAVRATSRIGVGRQDPRGWSPLDRAVSISQGPRRRGPRPPRGRAQGDAGRLVSPLYSVYQVWAVRFGQQTRGGWRRSADSGRLESSVGQAKSRSAKRRVSPHQVGLLPGFVRSGPLQGPSLRSSTPRQA